MLVILSFLLVSLGSILFDTLRLGISPMPSSKKAKMAMLSFVPKGMTGILYELGSGWGGLAIILARKNPLAHVFAYELSFIPWLFSLLMKRVFGIKNLHFLRKDFYQADLSDAAAIFCYLFPKAMLNLEIKLSKELKAGTIVVTNTFALPNAKAKKTIYLEDFSATRIYLYRKGSCDIL